MQYPPKSGAFFRSLSEHAALRAHVHVLVASGQLPIRLVSDVRLGEGDGGRCSLCYAPIEAHALKVLSERTISPRAMALHQQCFELWRGVAAERLALRSGHQVPP